MVGCEAWVTGRLIDSERRPLAGVVLHERIGSHREVNVEAGRSGADGRFAVCGEALTAGGGTWQLAGRRDHVRLTVTENGALDLDITIEPYGLNDDDESE